MKSKIILFILIILSILSIYSTIAILINSETNISDDWPCYSIYKTKYGSCKGNCYNTVKCYNPLIPYPSNECGGSGSGYICCGFRSQFCPGNDKNNNTEY